MNDRDELCKEFTQLTGGQWQEITFNDIQTVSEKAGISLIEAKAALRAEYNNPTYDNPADVLKKMFKFLSVECWLLFIKKHGLWHTEKTQQGNDFTEITRPYIPIELLEGDTILKISIEFLKVVNRNDA